MKQKRILVWHEFDGQGDTSIQVLEERCAAFSALGHGEIVPEVMNISALRERLAKIHQGGEAPDIAFVPADMLSLQDQALLSPLDPWTVQAAMAKEQWASMQLNGRQLGVPLLRGNHLVMFYNRELLAQPPASWEAIQALAPGLQQAGITPLAADCRDAYWFIPFLTAHQGWVLEQGEPALYREQTQQTLAFLQQQLADGVLASQQGATQLLDEFIAGRSAAIICGEWIFNYLAQQMGDRLAVAGLPTLHDQPMVSMTSTIGFVYPGHSLQGPNREQILSFTHFMLNDESQRRWVSEVQRWPVNQRVIDQQMQTASPARRTILALRQQCRPIPLERIMFDVWYAIDVGLARFFDKRCDAREAAAFMQVCARNQIGSQLAALI